MVGEQFKPMRVVHDARMRAARDAGYRGRGRLPPEGHPRGGTPAQLPPDE